MGTTALIVEMVIIGFQVLVWMALMVLTIFGYHWIDLSKLKDWSTIVSVALVGISYTLGIVFDSFIGSLFAPWEYSVQGRFIDRSHTNSTVSFGQMRAYIIATNSDVSDDLTKRNNRSSLVRATSLNLLLITLSSLVLVLTRIGFSWKLLTVIIVSSGLLTGLAISTWAKSIRGYYYYLNEVYKALKESEKNNAESQTAVVSQLPAA